MELEGEHRASASAPGLAHADKQIDLLFQQHLPSIPHVFFVPTNNPYRPNFPHENLNIPFERCEIPKLQYMTLISNGDRGVGASKGASDWEDEVYGRSPLSAAGQSSTSTPNPVRDPKKISQKISLGDYKNFKQTGVKPSPKPYTATPEHKTSAPGHSRNTSAVSAATPMGRVPSSDGDLKPIGSSINAFTEEKASAKEPERSALPRSIPTDAQGKNSSRPITNGHYSTPQSKELKESRAGTKSEYVHPLREQLKHPLPPRPRSPGRSNAEPKKRALDSSETHPEKRIKTGHNESRTPSSSHTKDVPRSSESNDIKPSPTKSQKLALPAPSSLPKKPPPPKPVETNGTPKLSKLEKPLHIPPLLSPLPADLESGPEPHSAIKKSYVDKVTPPKTPSKREGHGSDTIVVKQPSTKSQTLTSSPLPEPPKSSTPPFVLPRLLSPGLPSVVEEELLRLQQKSTTLNTVEARHEKARLPDAPGVARKTPRNAKVGHPPKRAHGEPKLPTVPEKEAKRSLVVKIPYKRRNANDIRRILALTQKPRGQMERLEAGERLARERSTSVAPPRDSSDSDSEEDVPISQSRGGKTPSAPTSKKRLGNSTDRNDPAPKRQKPEIDVTKASTPVAPAFKSPAPSNPSASSQKSLLATPKKGDAMKSVAMRRVDSNDGLARTPQTISTSTPASAERSRPNGVLAPPNPEVEKQRAAAHASEARFFPMGTTLKRQMDALISPKNREPSASIPESERKVGLCIGIESLMAYMLAFQARDRVAHLRGSQPDPATWDSFLKLHNFVVQFSKPYVELHALVEQMGAVARENLDKAFMAHMGLIKDGGKVERIVKDMKENSRLREITWISVKKNEKVLKELGVHNSDILGPWSSVPDAVTLASATLDVYSKKEKLKWNPDTQLAAARESGSSSGK